jgi:hypothetical protein
LRKLTVSAVFTYIIIRTMRKLLTALIMKAVSTLESSTNVEIILNDYNAHSNIRAIK